MHVKLLGAAALTAGVLAFGLATPAFASTSDHAPVHNPVSISCHDQNYGQENRDCFPPVTHEDNNCMQPYLTGSRYDFRYQVQPQECFRFLAPKACHPVVSMTEIRGVYYTGAAVSPGERLTYNRVKYTVKTVTPVFSGIHTGQSVVTFYSTAGLPSWGDVNVNFTASGLHCFRV